MKNEVSSEQLQKWISKNQKLSNLLVEIQEKPLSIVEQAELAYHEIPKLIGITKDNFNENYDPEESVSEFGNDSLYQQLGYVNYMNPNADPRGRVLTAAYLVKHGTSVPQQDILKKYKTESEEECIGIGFIGNALDVRLIFVKKGENWFELGCKMFISLAK
ncbi:hypothetical protein [Flavobacterium sp.]|uniref:hypothetical protein n=1 Tax=Flavobacterium sp. TaxID=239 RepID=UPI003B9CDFD1